MITKEEEIKSVINKIRPYIQRDGGDVEFVSFEEGVVKVKSLGACVGCLSIGDTLNEGIASILMDEVEGVTSVILDE